MMTEEPLKGEISPLSQEFTDQQLTVDVMIYKIEGNDGWTLEVALDDETSVTWTELFQTDQAAWDDFASAVEEVGLRRLVDGDDGEEVTIH
jgi:hypothetical protein